MPELTLTASVSRGQLALADLDINDHTSYYLADQLLGAQVPWNRTQVGSPFLDGQVTTQRNRPTVAETVGIEVVGTSAGDLQTKLAALIAAFIQDSFVLTLDLDGATYAYQCETADYQVGWNGPRFIAKQVQVLFNVPRQPEPISGGV